MVFRHHGDFNFWRFQLEYPLHSQDVFGTGLRLSGNPCQGCNFTTEIFRLIFASLARISWVLYLS